MVQRKYGCKCLLKKSHNPVIIKNQFDLWFFERGITSAMTQATVFVFLALTCFTGAMVQAISGFGFGILAMTAMPFFMPTYSSSLGVSNMLGFTNALFVSIKMRKHTNWKVLIAPLTAYVFTNFLAIRLSLNQSEDVLIKILGTFLILLGIYLFFFNEKVKIKPTTRNGVIAGLLGGVLSGLFGMGGPPLVVYLLAATKDQYEYMATIQTYFAVSNCITLVIRIFSNQITLQMIPLYLVGIVAVVLGITCGLKLFSRISAAAVKKIVYVVIALSGVTMLIK